MTKIMPKKRIEVLKLEVEVLEEKVLFAAAVGLCCSNCNCNSCCCSTSTAVAIAE